MGSDYDKIVRAKLREFTEELIDELPAIKTKEDLDKLRAKFDKMVKKGGKLYEDYLGNLDDVIENAKEMGFPTKYIDDKIKELKEHYWEKIVPNAWRMVQKRISLKAPIEHVAKLKVPSILRAPFIKEGKTTPVGEFLIKMIQKKDMIKVPKGEDLDILHIDEAAQHVNEVLSRTRTKRNKRGVIVYDIPKGEKGKEVRDALKMRTAISFAVNASKTFKNAEDELHYTGKGGLASAAKSIGKKRKKRKKT